MDVHLWHREKPFRGKLIAGKGDDAPPTGSLVPGTRLQSAKGLSPDAMRERAIQEGYLSRGATLNDLF